MIKRISAAACAALVFLGVAAQGAIVSYSQSFAPTAVGTPSFNVPLPKFDPLLGTLTSVALTLETTTAGGSLSFDNEAGVGGTVDLALKIFISATAGSGPALTVATNPIISGTSVVTGDGADGTGDFLGTDSFTISGGGSNNATTSQTLPAFLTQFTATMVGEMFDATVANTILTSSNTVGMFGPTMAAGGTYFGKVTVAYTYFLVPVPEAGTAFWGACLAAATALRRTRVRRA